jgi:nuclease S1
MKPRNSGAKTGSAIGRRRAVCAAALALLAARPLLGWGPAGHIAVATLAQRYLSPAAAAQVRQLLGPESLADASLWADEVAHSTRPETASWHYIDIPLNASAINLRRDCPGGNCVLVKTEQFAAELGNPRESPANRKEALEFVVHFVADLHQPLHCEDDHDLGGNTRTVIFDGHPDNLHWVWDTGLVEAINRDPDALAAELASHITRREIAAWQAGSIEDWVMESHRLAETVAYRPYWRLGPAVLDAAYDQRAEAVIEVQLEKAAVRLAYLLNQRLK